MHKDSNLKWQIPLYTLGLSTLALALFGRPVVNYLTDRLTKKIITNPYSENLWELYTAGHRVGLQNITETNIRAQEGKVINRPFGTPRKFPSTDDLLFNFAQLNRLPTPGDYPIDMSVTIGPQAERPLTIKTPIMIAGMAYGLGLSEKAKIALAQGATLAGTAFNNGEGPFLFSERKAAQKYILNYDRGFRNHNPEIIKKADAIEIQFGQGALGGTSYSTPYKNLPRKARKLLGLKPNEPCITQARVPGIIRPRRDLPQLVKRLKDITRGAPIGAKIAAGHELELDLDILADSEIDYIVVEGAQGATKGGPPILADDFGVPTLIAINRAALYLREQGLDGKISLVASSGLYNPGQFLKVLALGADAVYIGTIALFGMSHTQVLKVLPFEPPPSIVFADSKQAWRFNTKKGSQSLYRFLKSCTEEMAGGVRALGKTSLREVNRKDLRAISPYTAQALDLPLISKSIFNI